MKLLKYPIEIILAILGAALCLAVTVPVSRLFDLKGPIWSGPDLYFIEIPAVCVVAAGLSLRGGELGRVALWISAGIVFAFSLLGLSIGLYYLPVLVLLIISALVADKRANQPITKSVGRFFVAGIMLEVLNLVMAYFLSEY